MVINFNIAKSYSQCICESSQIDFTGVINFNIAKSYSQCVCEYIQIGITGVCHVNVHICIIKLICILLFKQADPCYMNAFAKNTFTCQPKL